MSDTETKEFFIDLDRETEDRYDLGKFMFFDVDNFDPLNSHLLEEIPKLKLGGSYVIKGEENRPDLLSARIFETESYWWIIIIYNGFRSVSEYTNGLKVSYPSVDALEDLIFSLKVKQNKVDKT